MQALNRKFEMAKETNAEILQIRTKRTAEDTSDEPDSKKLRVPECPICLRSFSSKVPLFNCLNGHFICGQCKNSLNDPVSYINLYY